LKKISSTNADTERLPRAIQKISFGLKQNVDFGWWRASASIVTAAAGLNHIAERQGCRGDLDDANLLSVCHLCRARKTAIEKSKRPKMPCDLKRAHQPGCGSSAADSELYWPRGCIHCQSIGRKALLL